MSEPIVAGKRPSVLQLEAGKIYWWCACGRSKDQPFCDGSHKGTGIEPRELVARPDQDGKFVSLCNCKRTSDAPWCDGSHKVL